MVLANYLKKHQITQKAFGDRLGVTPGLISQYISGTTKITAERAAAIERATGGEVKRHDLRPDLYAAHGQEAAA